MHLEAVLRVLVEDWRDLHDDGGTNLSVAAVVGALGVGAREVIDPNPAPAEVAALIMADLGRIPGALEKVERFAAQFQSPAELLEEFDLHCLVNDLLEMKGGDL